MIGLKRFPLVVRADDIPQPVIRKALFASLRAARLQKQSSDDYAPATDAAVLLERMSVDEAREHVRVIGRHLEAVWNEEHAPPPPPDSRDELDQREHEERTGA